MDMTGEELIAAPRARVYEALNDVDILKQSIPGCEEIEKTSDTEMTAKVVIKVGPVKAKFSGEVTLSDLNPPEGYTISGGKRLRHHPALRSPCGSRRQAGPDRRTTDRQHGQKTGQAVFYQFQRHRGRT